MFFDDWWPNEAKTLILFLKSFYRMRVLEELWLRELCASHKNSIIRPETSFIFVIIYGINYTVCNLIAIFEAEVTLINFYEQIPGIK